MGFTIGSSLSLGLVAAALLLLPGAAPVQDSARPEFWRLFERAVEQKGVGPQVEEVLEHMAGVPKRLLMVRNRLSRVDRGLVEPWTVPALGADLRDTLAAPALQVRGVAAGNYGQGIAEWLDLEPDPAAEALAEELAGLWTEIEDPELSGLPLLEALSALMGRAHQALEQALSELEPADRALLFDGHADFCEAWYRGHFPDVEQTEEQSAFLTKFQDALLAKPKQDRRIILTVASALQRLAEPDLQTSLLRRLAKLRADVPKGQGYDRDVRAVVGDLPANRVVLSGRSDATHKLPAALLIDLGGDDRYQRAAVVDGPEMLASVVLDLKGNDRYESTLPGPAYAAGGVALLIDRRGNDRYKSGRLGQAASLLGAAFLIDMGGDDEYLMEDFGQGHALCGVALLYDLEGDDNYTAWAVAQGGGIGYGLSALVDGEGDDEYLADLHWPDVYGNSGPDIYHGASQGYCTGIRRDIAGGLAALLDLGEGRDRYQSGNFSQGGGYFFSFGLLYDGGGDDENFGTRYSQGFGVHQALGMRWDVGGDDSYTCRSVAHTGMAWDEGVGVLLDEAGDDTYQVGGLGCGGAAQTGIAICIDLDGEDSYRSGGQSQGGTGSFEYHDKPSIGLLIDLGGGADSYSLEGRGNGTMLVTEGVGVFLDLKASTWAKALRSRLPR
jgi:hypothetical protein